MENKIWYKSTAMQGNIITIAGLLVKWLGLPVLKDEVDVIISTVFVLIGVAMAIIGRIKAKQPLGWKASQ